jgi:hypothetical protein
MTDLDEESKAEDKRTFAITEDEIGMLLDHVANGMQEKLSDGHFALAHLDAMLIERVLKAIIIRQQGGKK